MTQEVLPYSASSNEDPSSKIRLPPISFLSQAPTQFPPMNSESPADNRPASHASKSDFAEAIPQLKSNVPSSNAENVAKTASVGQFNGDQKSGVANSQPANNRKYKGSERSNGRVEPPQFSQKHVPVPQFHAPQQHIFHPNQTPSQVVQHLDNRNLSETVQSLPPRASQSLHHHHHHSHDQEHRHHHHHHHQQHPAPRRVSQAESQKAEPEKSIKKSSSVINSPVKPKKSKIRATVNAAKQVKKLMEALDLKRKHLGTLVYNPTTTWDDLQIASLRGLNDEEVKRLVYLQENSHARAKEQGMKESYIPVLPPLSESQINNLVEIKIPYKFIKSFQLQFETGSPTNPIPLWGGSGGLFSDDSDILGALKMSGVFTNTLDLKEWNSSWKSSHVVRPALVHRDVDGYDLLDLSVTILLLPGLDSYHGMYQNGIYSRSWVGQSPHDGLSYAIYDVKWESLGQFGKALSKSLKRAYQDEEEISHRQQSEGNGWVFKYKRARGLFQNAARALKLPGCTPAGSSGSAYQRA